MESNRPDFDEQDSGVPVTSPDRNPDPVPPGHSVPGGGEGSGSGEPVRDERASDLADDAEDGGPAVPGRGSGLDESNPAQGA